MVTFVAIGHNFCQNFIDNHCKAVHIRFEFISPSLGKKMNL